MTPRMKKYLKASRKNMFRNVWYDTFWAKFFFWGARPFSNFLSWLHGLTGAALDLEKRPRCEACNDTGFMFMDPEDVDLESDNPWCECVVGKAVSEASRYALKRIGD